MEFKAAFFDRDYTLVHPDALLIKKRNALFLAWTGREYASCGDFFELAKEAGGFPDAFYLQHKGDEDACVKEERAFLVRCQTRRLLHAGLKQGAEEKAEQLTELCYLKGIQAYEDAKVCLRALQARGLRLGVISDTSPSLRLTIRAAGLDKYFSSYTCSNWVGVMKPDPSIYKSALNALQVNAEESLYVDDYVVEADGARDLGMCAFHILREGLDRGYEGERPWDIHALTEMLAYLDGRET